LDDDQDGGWVNVSSGTGSPGFPGQRAVNDHYCYCVVVMLPSDPPSLTNQTASLSVQPFFEQMTTVSLYFEMGRPFPLKIAPSHGGMLTPI